MATWECYVVLIEIDCDIFKTTAPKPIQFTNGLNIVLGTKGATNSIGKSTMLMVIDFAFGGNDYTKLSKDVMKHKGEHEIRFAFQFSDHITRYMRSTRHPNDVAVCDDNYQPTGTTITLTDFRQSLSNAYGLNETGLTWREAVSGTFRIWQRGNDKPTLPLSVHRTDTHQHGITRLLGLFGTLPKVKDALEAEAEAKASVDAAKVAPHAYNLRIAASKAEFDANNKRIDELEAQLADLQASFGITGESHITEEQAQTLATLRRAQTPLYRKRTILTNQLDALTENKELGNKRRSRADFEGLAAFIPEFDYGHLEQIEEFHAQIKSLVVKQANKDIKAVSQELDEVRGELERLDGQIRRITTAPNITAKSAEAFHEVKSELARLSAANRAYEAKQGYASALAEARKKVSEESAELLNDIEKRINTYLQAVDGSFTNEQRKPPELRLERIDSYKYAIADDSGTGSGYRSLLSFDLALLEHSLLPAIIEDSYLFKQIETEAVERIIRHYSSINNKQIFIALDEVDKYLNVHQLIQDKTRLRLGPGEEALFAEEWGKKNP